MTPYTQPPPFHSQWGEDTWLAANRLVPHVGTFVDVGAGNGVRGSNTLYFEERGWRGLCVDPDPRNRQVLRASRNCAVETCAVAAEPGEAGFGMYRPKPSWSGLHLAGPDFDQITVTVRRLDHLLDRHRITTIDLLSIDVEGGELDVWDSLGQGRGTPRVVIVEYDNEHPDRRDAVIAHHLGREQYQLAFRTPANLIFESVASPWPLWPVGAGREWSRRTGGSVVGSRGVTS